jgi:hypothetical protein
LKAGLVRALSETKTSVLCVVGAPRRHKLSDSAQFS